MCFRHIQVISSSGDSDQRKRQTVKRLKMKVNVFGMLFNLVALFAVFNFGESIKRKVF